MKQLIYCSKAQESVTFEDIKKILERAREKNVEYSLTGMLLYNGSFFLQCLEGPQESIDSLYANILKDNRHKNVYKIDAIDIEKRDFGTWAMGFYNSKKQINDVIRHDDFDPYELDFNSAKTLLLDFASGVVHQ